MSPDTRTGPGEPVLARGAVPTRRWRLGSLALTAAMVAALGCGGLAGHLLLDRFGPPITAAPEAVVAPGREALRATFLVRSTLMALNDANRSGNYTVLRDLAGPRFRQRNSADAPAEAFAAFRRAGIDLSPAGMTPPLLEVNSTDETGALNLAGTVPAGDGGGPGAIRFALAFEPVEGHWRLLTLSVRA